MNTNSVSPTSPPLLEPGTRVGRWRVLEPVGAGGQGTVYRVEDTHHPGPVHALKFSPEAGAGRAEREVALVKTRAAHPHVVGFRDCVRAPAPLEGGLGLVMDWVPGLALDAWAETRGATFRQLASMGATVAATLGELHARGVLHRDLKPEHIRIREADRQPVLLDFGAGWYEGAAPLTTTPLPPTTQYLLTPEAVRFLWTSPQHPGERYAFSPGDDLYALGVCLYRAATGHYPVSESLPSAVLQYAIVYLRVPAPGDVNPRVPQALSEVITRLLKKDPGERYPDGGSVRAALRAALAHEPESWDQPLFEGEQPSPEHAGDAPGWRIQRPAKPRPSWTFAPPRTLHGERARPGPRWIALAALALLAVVGMTLVHGNARRAGGWATGMRLDTNASSSQEAPVPLKNQKQAPCTAKLEVEFSGACWLRLWNQPPNCPPQTVPYEDKCLLPVQKPPHRLPTSIDGGTED